MPEKAVAPNPAEVDQIAIRYVAAKAKVLEAMLAQRAAQKDLETIAENCIAEVRQFGSAHATKSKLLHGLKWELMATFGSSTSIDAAAVEQLRIHLQETKQTRLLKRMFESVTRWSLKSTARAEILKPDVSDEVRAKFAVCEVTKDRSPSLEARKKQALTS